MVFKQMILLGAVCLLGACATNRPDYRVITGPNPDAKTQMAAEELAGYLERMTGAVVEQASSEGRLTRGSQGTFLIGSDKTNPVIARMASQQPEINLDVTGLKCDGILIQTIGKSKAPVVVLGGQTPASNLYAVYDYLERYCDVGFFYDGDHVPRRETVPMTGLSLRHSPFFRDRHFGFSTGYGLNKYYNRFRSFDELEEMTTWMAKRKLNLTGWHMGCSPDGSGSVAEKVFEFDCRPEENYHAGWPGGTWDYPPAYRTKYLQHFFNRARAKNIRVYYSLALGEVPKQFREKHPDLAYVPHLGYEANNLVPGSDDARRITGNMINELNRVYGTDHIYQCTPFVESTGAATPEESLQIKLAAARQLCQTLADLDPKYVWQSDSWDFGAVPSVWTPERIQRYFADLSDFHDHMYMYDLTSDWWNRTDFFGGIDWALGVLHAFQGDDHLHGDLAYLIRNARTAVDDPGSTRLMGYYHVPEICGHNVLYYNLSTKLAWDPNGIGLEDFLERYCVTRYGREHVAPMLACTQKLVDAVYSGGGSDMFYQRMGIRYNPPASPPFDDFPAALGNEAEIRREVVLMEEVLAMALEQSSALADNPLYMNDLVDFARTMLGIKSNAYTIDAYKAFKRGDRKAFDFAADRALTCLDGISQILSTRSDFSLEAMIREIMKVPGVNPYLPRMIRQQCINDIYAVVENYEQLALYYKPKMEAYFDMMRQGMEKGETDFKRDDMDAAFNELDQRWRDNEAVCPQAWRYPGTTLEAIEANWKIVPMGEISQDGNDER